MQRPVVHGFVWVFALLVLSQVLFSSPPEPSPDEPDRALALNARPGEARQGGFSDDGIVIERDGTGQFHLTAQVNGEDLPFLVDTGADVVALTVEDAERLGIEFSHDDFLPIMQTASGVGYGVPIAIERIGLGGEEFQDVEGVVVQGLATNLLGQSVLRRLGKVELQGDTMVIHQP